MPEREVSGSQFPAPQEQTIEEHQKKVRNLVGIRGHKEYLVETDEGTKIAKLVFLPRGLRSLIKRADRITRVKLSDAEPVRDERGRETYPYKVVVVIQRRRGKDIPPVLHNGVKAKGKYGHFHGTNVVQDPSVLVAEMKESITIKAKDQDISNFTNILSKIDKKKDRLNKHGMTKAEIKRMQRAPKKDKEG